MPCSRWLIIGPTWAYFSVTLALMMREDGNGFWVCAVRYICHLCA